MAPLWSDLFCRFFLQLQDTCLKSTATESSILSAIWTCIVCLFAAVSAFFASIWQYFGADDGTNKYIFMFGWAVGLWETLSEFLLRPDVRNALIVWFVVFWICVFIPLILGFGPAGIIGGSLAAWFQSAVYGAFTPAGGLFAMMTYIGMLNVACPQVVAPSAVIASLVALIFWWTTSTGA